MAFPNDYTELSCRRLPANPNYLDFAADCGSELAKFKADYVDGKDVSSQGPVLVIPGETLVEEAFSGQGFKLYPAVDSEDNFALVVSDDPANKVKLQIENNTFAGPELYSVDLWLHSAMYDCAVGLTSSNAMAAGTPTVCHTHPWSTYYGKFVGCTNNDIVCPNMPAFNGTDGLLILFAIDGEEPIYLCAYNKSKTVEIADGILVGLVGGLHTDLTAYNCTFDGCFLGVLNKAEYDITCINVIAQNSTGGMGNFYEGGTGSIIQVTPCDGCGLSLAADGYTLLESDAGNGTDMSGDATFAFDDDINGELRNSAKPERGADAYKINIGQRWGGNRWGQCKQRWGQ